MSRNNEELQGISLLGNQKTQYPSEYAPEILEAFDNKHPDNDYFVKFRLPRVHHASAPMTRPARLCHHSTSATSPISKWWKANH